MDDVLLQELRNAGEPVPAVAGRGRGGGGGNRGAAGRGFGGGNSAGGRGRGRGANVGGGGGGNVGDDQNTAKRPKRPYPQQKNLIRRFLETFHPNNEEERVVGRNDDQDDEERHNDDDNRMDIHDDLPKYLAFLRQVARRQRVRLPVSLDDVADFFAQDSDGLMLLEGMQENTMRYLELFCEEMDAILLDRFARDVVYDATDTQDVFLMHRLQAGAKLPPLLQRRYEVYFVPRRQSEHLALRHIGSSHVGRLVRTRGIVVRASDLMPQLLVAAYVCDSCGEEIYQEVTGRVYMPLMRCPSARCGGKKGKAGTLYMQARGSRFVKFQELRIQELPDEVPVGHVPRSIACHIRGESTRKVTPGDVVVMDGVFLPAPQVGFQAMRAGLVMDTYMSVMRLQRQLKSYSEYRLTPAVRSAVEEAARAPDAYTRLAMSIAPEIYGHLDVKKALLLMMIGGVTRTMADGMMIRGDINVCLIGDPGVAKSQLLRHIAHIAPRGIYTSGKGSSGVGLTAAVMKDPVSGEFVLEGGSLVLADMGICCIDEFDKMADADRTAIHEVMEQQSISIAKAGITCSLNARAAILAAANPAYGRYNTSRTPAENINLPPALLSRFDLLFLLLDKPDLARDMALAKHVNHVHIHSAPPELEFEPFSSEFLRSYISIAKTFEPFVPEHLSDHIVSAYVNMRQIESKDMENAKSYTTARTLLAILRLSQALAKLRFASYVEVSDVDEAIRLMNASKISLVEEESRSNNGFDTITAIYEVIRSMAAAADSASVSYDDVLRRVVRTGYKQDDLNRTIKEYEALDILMLSADKSTLTFVQAP